MGWLEMVDFEDFAVSMCDKCRWNVRLTYWFGEGYLDVLISTGFLQAGP
jgi:hypothetical protein